jgi:hypothetical protein
MTYRTPSLAECRPEIEPTEYAVLIAMAQKEERTAGGIILTQDAQDQDTWRASIGRLVAVSPLAFTYDQWRGDPQGWKSAEDFVAEVPVVLRHTREANSKLQSKVNRIVGEVAKLTDAQKRQVGEQAVQSLVDAAASGDLEAVKRIGDDILKTATPPAEHPSFTAFKERNEWYAEDPEARAYVAMLDKQYADGGPITDPDAHFAKIEKAVRKRFPEHFEASGEERPQEPAQPRARLVGRGGSVDRPKSGDLTPTTMNREQRRAAEEAQVSAESYCKSWNVWQARQGDQRRSA